MKDYYWGLRTSMLEFMWFTRVQSNRKKPMKKVAHVCMLPRFPKSCGGCKSDRSFNSCRTQVPFAEWCAQVFVPKVLLHLGFIAIVISSVWRALFLIQSNTATQTGLGFFHLQEIRMFCWLHTGPFSDSGVLKCVLLKKCVFICTTKYRKARLLQPKEKVQSLTRQAEQIQLIIWRPKSEMES